MKTQRAELESKIISFIYEDNKNTAHFEYVNSGQNVLMFLWTYNNHQKEVHLYKSYSGESDLECLNNAYTELTKNKNKITVQSSYTVRWSKQNEDTKHNSYFYAESDINALEQFFYNKEAHSYIIHEVRQNPIS